MPLSVMAPVVKPIDFFAWQKMHVYLVVAIDCVIVPDFEGVRGVQFNPRGCLFLAAVEQAHLVGAQQSPTALGAWPP